MTMLSSDAGLHDITAVCFDALGYEVVDNEIIPSEVEHRWRDNRLGSGAPFFPPGRISTRCTHEVVLT
jgi:hypothetical protein